MKISDYQKQAAEFAIYPKNQRVTYPALGLIGEIGETANLYKKLIRDNKQHDLKDELGDVCWYAAMLATDCGIKLRDCRDVEMSDMSTLLIRLGLSGASAAAGLTVPVNLDRVMCCVEALAGHIGTTLSAVLDRNIEKLTNRKKFGRLKGSGDNR